MLLVAISGPSSSGKTTVATALHQLYESSILVHLDDFYLPDDQIPVDPEKQVANWDCASAIDFGKFTRYITDLQRYGHQDDSPTYEGEVSLKLSDAELKRHRAKITSTEIIVFVEGFMLFHDPAIIALFDVKLFFHAPYQTLKDRRESRAGYNTVAGFWVDPPNYFLDIVWTEFEKTHKYLFVDGDVNTKLNDYAREDLEINSFENKDGHTLDEMIDWAIDIIEAKKK